MLFQIERNFYDKALKQALAEDTPEEREAFLRMVYEHAEERDVLGLARRPKPAKKLDHNSLKWFMGLSGAAI